MKKLIILTFVFYAMYFAACQKQLQAPVSVVTKPVVTTVAVTKPDTIPDKGIFKLKLGLDSINTDETNIVFKHTSVLDYDFKNDALYFLGYGKVSLATISHDGRDMAIYDLPYTSGMVVNLDMSVKTSGSYFFNISYSNLIPSNIKIYLKDNLKKDSVDVRTTNYNFTVDKTDTTTFGNKRFSLIIKDGGKAQ